MIKRISYIFIIVLAASLVKAQSGNVQDIKAPGANGLVETVDYMDMDLTTARRLHNLSNYELGGGLRNRRGLDYINSLSASYTYINFYGFYDSYFKKKLFIRMVNTASSRFAKAVISDTNRTNIYSHNTYWYFKYSDRTVNFDLENIYNQLIIADGYSQPSITRIEDGNRPHSYVLGLLAPGQLRAVPISSSTTTVDAVEDSIGQLTGFYIYAYAYTKDNTLSSWAFNDMDSSGLQGVSSVPVNIGDSNHVMLQGFEGMPRDYNDLANTQQLPKDTNCAIIVRKYVGHGDDGSYGHWQMIDTVLWSDTARNFYYIDSCESASTAAWYDYVLHSYNKGAVDVTKPSYIPPPGSYARDSSYNVYTLNQDYNSGLYTLTDTTVDIWIAYTYYDPVTNMESPFGRFCKIDNSQSIFKIYNTTDSMFYVYRKGHSSAYTRPDHIIVYRSIGGDRLNMVPVVGIQSNKGGLSTGGDSLWNRFEPFTPADSTVIAGEVDNSNNANSAFSLYFPSDHVGGYSLYGCPFALTDIEFAHGRAFGIGNPEFPRELYWSRYGTIGNWNPFESYEFDDELVSLEGIDDASTDILLVMGGNKIFRVFGENPEVDLEFKTLFSETGAMNKESIVNFGGYIYFLGANKRIYRAAGGQKPEFISKAVDTWMRANANDSMYAYRIKDNICWTKTSLDGLAYAFNYMTKSWSTITYGGLDSLLIIASIPFDTLSNEIGFAKDNMWLFDNTGKFFDETDTVGYDHVGDADVGDSILWSEMYYESPCYGDGVYIYRMEEVWLELDISNGDSLYVHVKDDDDSLASKGILLTASDLNERKVYRVRMPENIGDCLSFWFHVAPELYESAKGSNAFRGRFKLYSAKAIFSKVRKVETY